MRKSIWRILAIDLTDTGIGWLVVSFLIPCGSLWIGFAGITTQEMTIKGAEVYGITAVLYGSAFISFGLGTLFVPTPSVIRSSYAREFHLRRILLSMIMMAALILAGFASMF